MALIPRLSSLWRNLVHRDRVDQDLDDEVRAVFELLVEENRQRGLGPEEARRAAALELGRAQVIKDQVRDRRAGALIDTCLQDLRIAWRGIRAAPGPAAAAVLVLALGAGLNTAVLAVAYAGSFAGVAFLLALVGLAAALARAVTERRRELAIRAALGASARRTVGLMFTRGAALAAAGIATGLGVAALATQGLGGMLYGLGPRDPTTFAASGALVGIAALLTCYLTTRRIARIAPAELLRTE